MHLPTDVLWLRTQATMRGESASSLWRATATGVVGFTGRPCASQYAALLLQTLCLPHRQSPPLWYLAAEALQSTGILLGSKSLRLTHEAPHSGPVMGVACRAAAVASDHLNRRRKQMQRMVSRRSAAAMGAGALATCAGIVDAFVHAQALRSAAAREPASWKRCSRSA
jgi:hypothetical protein